MRDKTACSYAFLACMREGNYFEATRHARAVLEDFGDVIRHHEMMLSVNLRRENVAAALENCNEILSYGKCKNQDVAEHETHREALLARLARTRQYLAPRFWDEVARDLAGAPARYAGVPLILAGEASCRQNTETGTLFLVFSSRSREEGRIACRLAPCENPFVAGLDSPAWVAVHGRFLSASASLVLLDPCHYLGTYSNPLQ